MAPQQSNGGSSTADAAQGATESGPAAHGAVADAVDLEEGPESLSRALMAHLTAAAQIMGRLSTTRPEADKARWRKHETQVQSALRMVQRDCASDAMRPGLVPSDGSLDPQRLKEFGELLVKARQRLGLSQNQLATRSGLSRKTIWNLEHGTGAPNRDTIFRLLFIKELGLSVEQVPWRSKLSLDVGAAPNCWIAPGYEPLKLFAELYEAVNGPGGRLEQTFAYLDHQSADNWYKLCNQPIYALKYRTRAPIDTIAGSIVQASGHARLDVVALGAGDGVQETRLVENLLLAAEEARRESDLRLFLLDISQPLLSEAYKHAARAVGHDGKVMIQAIQGNFHHWPRYKQLHHTDVNDHRRQLITIFGATVGNLDNEANYFQNTLVGLAAGDLLLLDIHLAYGDPSRPEEILRLDPAFSHGPSPEHKAWLTGPLRSYCPDVLRVELRYQLNLLTVVPGSYAIDVVADVEYRDHTKKVFPSLFRFKRYDPTRLAATLRMFGWELLETAPYGPAKAQPSAALMLFRKTSPVGS